MNSIALIPESFELSQQLYYVLVKPDGYYAGGNPYFIKRFGLTEEKITTIHSLETIHPDDHTAYAAAIKACSKEPGKVVPVHLRKSAGKDKYVSTRWEFSCIEGNSATDYYIQCIGL